MQYIYKNSDGTESEPQSLDQMIDLIARRNIAPDTPVRNAMWSNFSSAESHHILAAHLLMVQRKSKNEKIAPDNQKQDKYIPTGVRRLMDITRGAQYRTTKCDAPPWRRVCAGLFDIALGLIILAAMVLAAFQYNWNSGALRKWHTEQQLFYGVDPLTTPHGSAFYINDPFRKDNSEAQTFEISDGYFHIANYKTQTLLSFKLDDVDRWINKTIKLWFIAFAAYYVIFLSTAQRTPGMNLFRVQLLDSDGCKPGFGRVCAFTATLFLMGWLYAITALFTMGMGLHVLLSKTSVVKR